MTLFTQTLTKEAAFGKGLDLISEFNMASDFSLNDSCLDDMPLENTWMDNSMWAYIQPSWSYSSNEGDQFLDLESLNTTPATMAPQEVSFLDEQQQGQSLDLSQYSLDNNSGPSVPVSNSDNSPSPSSPRAPAPSPVSSPRRPSGPHRTATSNSVQSPRREHRAHYAIEKRYRASLNDKFEALRNCLVSARAYLAEDYRPDAEGESNGGGSNEGEVQVKMNKTRVLSEAVEYIKHLESQNDACMDHIEVLEEKIRALALVGLRGGEEEAPRYG